MPRPRWEFFTAGEDKNGESPAEEIEGFFLVSVNICLLRESPKWPR